jgi:hypothetical protein
MIKRYLFSYVAAAVMLLALVLSGCSADVNHVSSNNSGNGGSGGSGSSGSSGSTASAAFTVADAATGVSLFVPEGAYAVTSPQPKFTVSKNAAPLPGGNPVGTNGGAVGDVFVITSNYPDDFMQPVEVTLPYNPAGNAFPAVVFYDTTSDVYAPMEIINLTSNTVTFSTVHFSSTYASVLHTGINMATTDLTNLGVNTGFVPNSDGFDVANFGNFVSPDGSGLGMSNYAAWYYNYKKLKGQPQLYNKYNTIVEKALIASIQSSSSDIWKKAWNSSNNTLDNKQVGMLMLLNMKLTNKPQIFIMKSVDANNKTDFAHVTLAYNFVPTSADGGIFSLYDPNFPGEVVTINFSLTNGFTGYSKAGAFSQTFSRYSFSAPSTIGSCRQFESAYQAAEHGLGSINLTAPTLNASDVATVTVTSATLPNVTVTGSVTGALAMREMFYALNGGTPVSLGSSSSFNFTLPGSQLTNPSIVTIFGLSNKYDHWSIVAFRQISLVFTGTTVASFVNMGFETGDMTSWLVETRLDNSIDPYYSALASNTARSPFAKISATTVYAWSSNGCPGSKPSDGKGHCYDANGTVNPDYDQYWGMLTAFNGSVYNPAKSSIVKLGDTDPRVGNLFPLVWNGNYALRTNNDDYNDHVSTASQIATIPTVALPTLKFAWAAVLEDPGHEIYAQPYVDVLVKDITANKILFFQRFASNDPAYGGWLDSPVYGWRLIPWQTISLDVSSARGNQVMIRVTGADCAYGGHGGYVYLDDSQ